MNNNENGHPSEDEHVNGSGENALVIGKLYGHFLRKHHTVNTLQMLATMALTDTEPQKSKVQEVIEQAAERKAKARKKNKHNKRSKK